jgi:hypothetical protein
MSLAQETARKGITVNSVRPATSPPRWSRPSRRRPWTRSSPRSPSAASASPTRSPASWSSSPTRLGIHHRPDLLRQRRPVHVVPRRAGRRRLPARRLPGHLLQRGGGGVGYGEDDMTDDVSAAGPNGHQQGRSDPDDLPQRRRAHVDRDRHGNGPAPVHRTPSRPRAGRVEDPRADRRRRLLRRVAPAADRRRRRYGHQPRGTRLSGAAGPLPGPRRRRAARGAGRP